jgi:catechol 2,3-dioxygenase-like lactoylglutathione lyase family enzyme
MTGRAARANRDQNNMMKRQVDHVVIAVRDLEAAATFYERLGFQVGARNRHPWGTENRLIQFAGSFIELITVAANADDIPSHAPGRFSFGAFVRDYLREQEGFAMMVLDSQDAASDAALFAREGLGQFEPLYFERENRRPDGTQTRVAFTLASAADARAPRSGFLVCQQHFPENFWNPLFQRHENGASGIMEIGMAAACPSIHQEFLSIFSGAPAERHENGDLLIRLRNARLMLVTGSSDDGDLHFNGFTIMVSDLAAQARRLVKMGLVVSWTNDCLSISPEAAFGLTIRFGQGSLV